jgi:type I restriction enzyme M protein
MTAQQLAALESRLWSAADQLRANSDLNSSDYVLPVLGLIFLRHATTRFDNVVAELSAKRPTRGGKALEVSRAEVTARRALWLPEEARYDYLLNLPSSKKVDEAVTNAMEAIEKEYPTMLSSTLPKDYQIFSPELLSSLLKTFNDDALRSASGDVFGRIYEYFLQKFALIGAQDNGEFFTPPSLVQTIVNFIEPDHGIVTDPACGSGGMFVQSSHFLEDTGRPDQIQRVSFQGQEKNSFTIRLAKMNLAVHGLEGKIEQANTFYEDKFALFGRADFVMANPPFNVDEVDAEKVKTDKRLPFGIPGQNAKGKVSNGNYLWISYFYAYLNATGRAGFVMSSQASSAGGGERDVRRKLVETGHVDAMVSIRSNFFYTRTVPCELWFLDKGKPADRLDHVLMLDARSVYRKVTRKVYDFTPEQLQNLTAIVWLYRQQPERYLALLQQYAAQSLTEAQAVKEVLAPLTATFHTLHEALTGVPTLSELSKEWAAALPTYTSATNAYFAALAAYQRAWPTVSASHATLALAHQAFEAVADHARRLARLIEAQVKLATRAAEALATRAARRDLRTLDDERLAATEQIRLVAYYHRHSHWLQSRFPEAKLVDVPGLVRLVTRADIEANDWSLTPGRYVGVAPAEVDEDFDFEETMRELHAELAGLNEEAAELATTISSNFNELVG